MRRVVLTLAVLALTACSAPPDAPVDTTPPESYFAEPPTDVSIDETARCVDSDLPNITEDEYVGYWETIFADQRAQYPDQSFPSPAQLAEDKRTEWRAGPNDAVPVGGDAAFARAVCGLPYNDGALYSGVQFRQIRGQAAQYGRATCNSVAGTGVRQLWEQIHPDDDSPAPAVPPTEAAQFELMIYSALTDVCPQLADYQGLPQIEDCSKLTPDPSADPGEGVFCRGGR